MKKKTNLLCPVFSGHRKIFRTMRISLFLVLISTLQILAGNSYSQSTRLSLEMKNVTIKDVLAQIEEKSGFYFLYDNGLIDVHKKVDIVVQNEQIDVILDKLFGEGKVKADIRDKHIILALEGSNTSQQPLKISGRVTDSNGIPLPGVTVIVKGTTQGVITDADGNYSLNNISTDAILVFSFVGMKTHEVPVAGKTSINAVMEEDAIGIEEVVAIGYGTMKKNDLTGAIGSVSNENLTVKGTTSPMEALQGQVAGVNINSTSGRTGTSFDIQIRGENSIRGGNPLYVVDGMVTGNIQFLNPQDIERIDILKDASSTANLWLTWF